MSGPVVGPGGGVPVDPETGQRYGYLPRRAANRKLVIRAQLGLPWVLAALGAAALIAVVAFAFALSRPTHPGAPYVDEGSLRAYPEQAVAPLRDRTGWLDRRTGLAAVTGDLSFCPADGGWVDAAGDRTVLTLWAVRAASGHVYVDRTHATTVTTEPRPPCPSPWRVTDPAPPDGL